MTTATLPSIRSLTDDDLATMIGGPHHDAAAAEIDRRDQAERKPRRASGSAARYVAGPAADWYEAAHAQFVQAERETNGYLLSPESEAAGISDPFSLWRAPERLAMRYASEELREVWYRCPRLTMTEYRRQAKAERDHETEARDMGIAGMVGREVVRGAVRSAQQNTGQAACRHPQRWAPGSGTPPCSDCPRKAAGGGPVQAPASVKADYEAAKALLRAESAVQAAAHAPGGALDGAVVPAAYRQRDMLEAAAMLREVLNHMALLITDYVEMPRSAAVAYVLWVAQAACRDADGDMIWMAFPRLLITALLNGSGKSTLGDFGRLLLACRAGRMSKVTAYGLTKVFGTYKEAAIADDAQNIFSSDKAAVDLLTVLVNGYTEGATWVTGKSDGKIEPAAGPVMIIGKDELITKRRESLKDLLARSVIVRLERPDCYQREFDEDARDRAIRIGVALKAVTGALQGELKAAAKALANANVGQPIREGDGGRTAQIRRPLLAVAAVADMGADSPRWSTAAQAAMDELSAASGDLVAVRDALSGLAPASEGRSFWDDETSEEN